MNKKHKGKADFTARIVGLRSLHSRVKLQRFFTCLLQLDQSEHLETIFGVWERHHVQSVFSRKFSLQSAYQLLPCVEKDAEPTARILILAMRLTANKQAIIYFFFFGSRLRINFP